MASHRGGPRARGGIGGSRSAPPRLASGKRLIDREGVKQIGRSRGPRRRTRWWPPDLPMLQCPRTPERFRVAVGRGGVQHPTEPAAHPTSNEASAIGQRDGGVAVAIGWRTSTLIQSVLPRVALTLGCGVIDEGGGLRGSSIREDRSFVHSGSADELDGRRLLRSLVRHVASTDASGDCVVHHSPCSFQRQPLLRPRRRGTCLCPHRHTAVAGAFRRTADRV